MAKNTKSLLHFDTNLTNSKNRNFDIIGNPQISNAVSKFGKSLYLDGSSYLSTPITSDLNLSTGDFTIEWFEYRTNASTHLTTLTFDTGTTSGVYDFILGYSDGANVLCYASSNNSSWNILNALSLGSISLNQWSHYTLVRSGNVFTTYKDGIKVSTATSNLPIKFDILTKLLIGNSLSPVNGIYAGYIDELRISNTARYTDNFTPSTVPFVEDANTLLLLHFEERFTNFYKDESGKDWFTVGSPALKSNISKFGSKSLYLDGSSYLQTPSSEDFNFATGDFTVEWWEYNISNSQYSNPIQIGSDHCKALLLGHYYNDNRCVFCGNIGTDNNILKYFSLGSFELNKWCHFALVRSGNTFYGFKNGVLTSTSVSNESLTFPDYKCTIGNAIVPGNSNNYKFNGYIDEVRIVKGVAKYTANFVPPTQELSLEWNNIAYLTNDDKLYGKVGYNFTKLSDTYSAMTSADVKAAIDSTDTNTATVEELQTIGAFKVLNSDRDATTDKTPVSLSVVNKDTLITPKGLISLKSIEGIDNVSLTKSITGTGSCRLLVTNDLITYKTFDGTNFVDIDHTNLALVKTNGITPEVLSTITREKWDTLTVGKPGIGFAYLPTIEEITDTYSIADISMTADMKGSWKKPPNYSDTSYEYPLNDVLRINLNTEGSYKINYKD